jgi:4-alpha-glucanotransferase
MPAGGSVDAAIADALARLGKDRFVLGLPDRSFPVDPDEDTGAGTPYGAAGERFLALARGLGFTAVQLGPQGETSPGDASPYDGTLFSRTRLTVSLGRLDAEGRLPAGTLAALVAARPAAPPDRIPYRAALALQRAGLDAAYAASRARPDAATLAAFARDAAGWLERDALWEALDATYGTPWPAWPGLDARLWSAPPAEAAAAAARRAALATEHAAVLQQVAFVQWVAHAQHAALRATARRLGLELWGDLQIGFSARDAWAWQRLFLPGYRLGAPPSRTNPAGQPWGYPVLDPGLAEAREAFVARRLEKAFAEYDGIRIDHPHGWVCPWVYDASGPDAETAVQAGARLFAAPDLPDHPALARFAIARRADLNPSPGTPRHADDWVVRLDDAQVDRYDALVGLIVAAARRHGHDAGALACEVLSTSPYPLRRVLERHGLGRFRITQKVDLADPDDVYRSEHAAPADWVMVGTHDTRPLRLVVDAWARDGTLPARAAYLAWRLAPADGEREALARRLAASPDLVVQAQLADLFASRARNVLVFFTDLFGMRALYNRPGVVADENWTVRLPADWAARYAAGRAAGTALDVPRALALALRARRRGTPELLARLETSG